MLISKGSLPDLMELDQLEKKRRADKVRLLILDCDGVLTDGRLYYGADGEEIKVFHVRDGQGIVDWHSKGFITGIISGRSSPIVSRRASELGIRHIIQGRNDKLSALTSLLNELALSLDEVAYLGDDKPDIEPIKKVALGAAVADAHPETQSNAAIVLKTNGGKGAAREFIDMILDLKSS